MASLPLVKAFLVCDAVIHEAGTNKKSLIGIFQRIHARRFPCRHGALMIYAAITDTNGEYTFDLELVDLTDGKRIGRGTTPALQLHDRLRTAELTFRLENIVFPQPGKYEFRLHANHELLAQDHVEVAGVEKGERP